MILVPINLNVKQRDTLWICVCPNCQWERHISYTQKWNIETKKCSDICKSCQIELDIIKINKNGLKLGRKFNKRKNKYKSHLTLFYNNLFSNNEKKIIIKEKQRNTKLGKFGEKANNWQGGKTSERMKIMAKDEYKLFRKQIFERDNYTCLLCNKLGGQLNVDHIKEWCNYPELRLDINNCRTLCLDCHKKTDNYLSKAKRKKICLSA